MDLLRIDVLSIFDVTVKSSDDAQALGRRLKIQHRQSRMSQLLDETYDWIFYEKQRAGFDLFDLSLSARGANMIGMAVRFSPKARIGTYTIWRKYDGHSDPLELKRNSWEDAQEDVASLQQLCPEAEIERQYPFVAVELAAENLSEVCGSNAEYIGKIFTGDHEGGGARFSNPLLEVPAADVTKIPQPAPAAAVPPDDRVYVDVKVPAGDKAGPGTLTLVSPLGGTIVTSLPVI